VFTSLGGSFAKGRCVDSGQIQATLPMTPWEGQARRAFRIGDAAESTPA
jgi:hypothetical protein